MNYIRLAIIVVIGCVIGFLALELWQARASEKEAIANAATYKTQVDGLVDLNAQQAATIARLANQRVLDDAAVKGLNDTLAGLQNSADQQAAAIKALADDPASKAFLDTTLPPNVIGVFRQ